MTPIVSTTLLRTQSDARLVDLARGGSERAFEAIVERHRRPLTRYCGRLVGDSRAEDVVQEVFVKAWTAMRAGPEVVDLRPWLYRIAHNTSLNALRKSGYDYVELHESLRTSHAEPEAEQERRAVVLRTLSGVAALPAAQREALLRTAVDGLSQEEVAHELGLSEPAVRGLVYRARETLRAAATALTPPPLLNWLLGMGGSGGGTPRIAELVAGGGGTAGAGLMVKAGALIGAGAIATGAASLQPLSPRHGTAPAAADAQVSRSASQPARASSASSDSTGVVGDDHGGRGRHDRADGDSSGHSGGGGDDRSDDHRRSGSSGSSGPGSGGDSSGSGGSAADDSSSGSSGSGTSGTSGSSGSGASGSDSSGSGSLSSGDSTSGTSGSGISGSGSSGPGSDDLPSTDG
ncbi:MAG: hypothetical protein QOI98_2198 [Solirubrobacteraceae bacterium]|nr:hypothetical protein [Solirubrobacteraceae bacterium]